MRWLFAGPANIDHARVVAAIRAAESRTSGEIRVLVARHRAPRPVAAARRHFERLGLSASPPRNAVLIFVAPRSRTFAVIGDRAVHEKCGDEFWRGMAEAMTADFKRGDYTYGICSGVERAGALLAEHFPPDPDHPRPAPDDIDQD